MIPYISSMPHNNGVMGWIKPISKYKFKESFSNVEDIGVGGLNHTPI